MALARIIICFILWTPGITLASAYYPLQAFEWDTSWLELRLEDYLLTHKKPPLASKHFSDAIIRTDQLFMKELQNYRDGNIRMTESFLKKGDNRATLLDPWGRPYFILVDFDQDQKLIEPNKLGGLGFTDRSFLMWSIGPDGKYGTPESNADNLYSYPGHTETYETFTRKQQWIESLTLLQILAASLLAISAWFTKLRTYPLFSMLSGEVFQIYFRRHLRRSKIFISLLVIFEVLLCVLTLSLGTPDYLLPNVLITILWLYLINHHLPRLAILTPETAPRLAQLTLIPAAIWTTRAITLSSAL